MDGAGFHHRFFIAWNRWELKNGRELYQTELGQMIGKVGGEVVSQPTISGWRKDVVPSVHQLEYLAKALGVDVCWLAFGHGKEPDNPVPTYVPVQPPKRR